MQTSDVYYCISFFPSFKVDKKIYENNAEDRFNLAYGNCFYSMEDATNVAMGMRLAWNQINPNCQKLAEHQKLAFSYWFKLKPPIEFYETTSL
mgnify:CR=1 FL=1